jgi:hypothetical protein
LLAQKRIYLGFHRRPKFNGNDKLRTLATS